MYGTTEIHLSVSNKITKFSDIAKNPNIAGKTTYDATPINLLVAAKTKSLSS